MNWITNYVRPRINSIFSRRETPDNLWTKCDECGTMLFHRELSDNLNVCTNCGHHMPISPRDRFLTLFDGGVFSEIEVPQHYFPADDPSQDPKNRWCSHAHLLYGNWISEIYLTTPYDASLIGQAQVDLRKDEG